MKKLLLACMMAFGLGASAQITVAESFEGTALPTGWTSSAATFQALDASAGTPCAGAKSLRYNLYSGATSWNIVYSSTASNGLALNYSYSYLAKGFSTTGAIKGSVKAEYSADNGSTWVQLGSTIALDSPNATPIPCVNLSGTIPAGTIPVGASFKFRLTGTYASPGDFYIGFDDVKLSQEYTAAPTCTTLSLPAAAATGVSLTPTLIWNASSGATSYLLSVGTTAGGTNVINNVDVGNTTSYIIPSSSPLNYNTNYYVTVTPKNNLGSASGCTSSTFTTRNIACPSVSLPSSSSATGVSVTPTITWASISDATGYKLSIGTTAGGTDVLNALDLGNATTYTHNSPLLYGTKYYYTVNSYNATTTSSGCTERNFTTLTLCPSVTTPSSASATGVSITPAFAWTAISGVSGYRISIGTTAGGTDVLNAFDLGNVTTYTHNSPLLYGTKYFYTIVGYTAGQVGTGCTERNFTTVTLCPSVTAPSSLATNVSITPTFVWTAFTGATGYKISIGTTTGGTDIMNNVDVGNVTTYTLQTPLAFSTKYYYTVSGYNANQANSACSERSFTTQNACPLVTYPDVAATLQPVKPTIKWNSIATASSYTLTVGTTTGGTDIMNNVDVGNVTSYTFTTPLTLGTKYYYKVNTNTSTGCTERTFTVNTVAAPSNDDCSGAVEATGFPYTYAQTNGAGSTNGTGYITVCSTGGSNDGLWFKFTGNGEKITVKATTTSAWDHRVSVYSGACGAFTCVGTADELAGTLGNIETVAFNSVAGTQYFVNVGYYSGTSDSAEGNFNLDITSTAILATSDVQPAKAKDIKVYPNPFVDELNISDVANVKSVLVIDIAGRLIKTIDKPSSTLHLGDLKQGLYLVTLEMKDGTRQVIKAIKR